MKLLQFLKTIWESPKLLPKQQIALDNYQKAKGEQIHNIHRSIEDARKKGLYIDYEGIGYMQYRLNEEAGYMSWLIREHPEKLREDGTFKIEYYENNKLVNMV